MKQVNKNISMRKAYRIERQWWCKKHGNKI